MLVSRWGRHYLRRASFTCQATSLGVCMHTGWAVLWKICTRHYAGKQQPCSSRCSGEGPVAFLLRLLEGQCTDGRRLFISLLCIPTPSTRQAWWLRALAEEAGCLGSLPHLILCYCLTLCFWVKDLRAGSFLVDNPRKPGEGVRTEEIQLFDHL